MADCTKIAEKFYADYLLTDDPGRHDSKPAANYTTLFCGCQVVILHKKIAEISSFSRNFSQKLTDFSLFWSSLSD